MFTAGLALLGALIVAVPPPSIVMRYFSLRTMMFSLQVPNTDKVVPALAASIAPWSEASGQTTCNVTGPVLLVR
jgi:hypothetical protein